MTLQVIGTVRIEDVYGFLFLSLGWGCLCFFFHETDQDSFEEVLSQQRERYERIYDELCEEYRQVVREELQKREWDKRSDT